MSTFLTAIRLALATLRLNPLRTSLSTLGIVMGAASLAAVLALGDGAEQAVGLVFGTYPALRASRLAPIDAIQRE